MEFETQLMCYETSGRGGGVCWIGVLPDTLCTDGDSRTGPNRYALGSFTYLALVYICELIKALGAIDLSNSVTAGVPPALNFYSHEGFSAEGVIGAVRHSECTRS